MGTNVSMSQQRGDFLPQRLEVLPMHVMIRDLSCGLGHALFLDTHGNVYSWGNGGNGRLGHGDNHDRAEACIVDALCDEEIIKVQCGASHSLALTSSGQMYSWGKNSQGQCGLGNMEDTHRPHLVKKLGEVVITSMAAGWEHSLALTSGGKIYSWGSGYKDSRRGIVPPVLGLGHSECRPNPELITSIEAINIKALASGWDHCMALDEHGKLLSWGSGQNGKLGQENEENIAIPCYIAALEQYVIVSFSAGCEHSACVTSSGECFSWGHGEGGRLGHGHNSPSNVPVRINAMDAMQLQATFVHCGDKFSMIIAQPKPPTEEREEQTQLLIKAAQKVDSIDWEVSMYLEELDKLSTDNLSGSSNVKNDVLHGDDVIGDVLLGEIKTTLHAVLAQTIDSGTETWTSEERKDADPISSLSNRSLGLAMMATMATKAARTLFQSIGDKVNCSDTPSEEASFLSRAKMLPLNDKPKPAKVFSDIPFVVEHCEDAYCNFSAFLEILSGPFQAYNHGVLDDGILSTLISNSGGRDHGYEKYIQDIQYSAKLLYHLLILLATNFQLLSEEMRRRIQKAPRGTDVKVLLRGGPTATAALPLSSQDLSFIMRRDTGSVTGEAGGDQGQSGNSVYTREASASSQVDNNSVDGPNSVYQSNNHDSHYIHHQQQDYDGNSRGALSRTLTGRGSESSDDGALSRYRYDRDELLSKTGDGESDFDASQEFDGDDNYSAYSSVQHQHQQSQHQQQSSSSPNRNLASINDRPHPRSQHGASNAFLSNSPSVDRAGSTTFGYLHDGLSTPLREESHGTGARSTRAGTMGSLSPAPSYESLEHSLRGDDDGNTELCDIAEETIMGQQLDIHLNASNAQPSNSNKNLHQQLVSVGSFPRINHNSTVDEVVVASQNEMLLIDTSALTIHDDVGPAEGSANGFEEFNDLDLDINGDDEEDEEDLDEVNEQTIQLQQALLLSIGPKKVAGIDSRFLGPVAGRRGSSVIPSIRHTINTLASLSYMVLQAIRDHTLQNIATQDPDPAAESAGLYNGDKDMEDLTRSAYRIWEASQLTTASGFDCLYDEVEQKSVLLQIFRSPQSFLYIIPGIMKGLQNSGSAYRLLQDIFADTNLKSFVTGTADQEAANGSTMSVYLEDVLRVLEQLILLYQAESDLRSAIKQSHPSARHGLQLALSLHRKVHSSFSKMTNVLLSVVLPLLMTTTTAISDGNVVRSSEALEIDALCREKLTTILEVLFDCCMMDIEAMFSISMDSEPGSKGAGKLFMSSFLMDILPLLFSSNPSAVSKKWHVSEIGVLISFACQFLQQVRVAMDMLQSKCGHLMVTMNKEGKVVDEDSALSTFECIFQHLNTFLCDSCVLLLASSHVLRHTPSLQEWISDHLGTFDPVIQALISQAHHCFDFAKSPMEYLRASLMMPQLQALCDVNDKVHFFVDNNMSSPMPAPSSSGTDSSPDKKRNVAVGGEVFAIAMTQTNALMELVRQQYDRQYMSLLTASLSDFADPYVNLLSLTLKRVVRDKFVSVTHKDLFQLIFRALLVEPSAKNRDIFSSVEIDDRNRSILLHRYLSSILIYTSLQSLNTEHDGGKISDYEEGCINEEVLSNLLLAFERLDVLLPHLNAAFLSSSSSLFSNNGDVNMAVFTTLLQHILQDITNIQGLYHSQTCLLIPKKVSPYGQHLFTWEVRLTFVFHHMAVDYSTSLAALSWQELQTRNYFDGLQLVLWVVEVINICPSAERLFLQRIDYQLRQCRVSSTIFHLDNYQTLNTVIVPRHLHSWKRRENTLHSFLIMLTSLLHDKHFLLSERLSPLERRRKAQEALLCHLSLLESTQLLQLCASLQDNGLLALRQSLQVYFHQLISRYLAGSKSGDDTPDTAYTRNESDVLDRTVAMVKRYRVVLDASVLEKIMSCIVDLTSEYQALYDDLITSLWNCHALAGKCLHAQTLKLDISSPVVISSTSSPSAAFTLILWVRLPIPSNSKAVESRPIHLLTRFPETGESNQLDMLTRDPKDTDHYTLAFHAIQHPTTQAWQLQVSVLTYYYDSLQSVRGSNESRKKRIQRNHLVLPLVSSNHEQSWMKISVQIRQKNESMVSKLSKGHGKPMAKVMADSWTEILIVQSNKHQLLKERLKGGNWPLHQNVLLGSLPSQAGRYIERETGQFPLSDSSKSLGISLADVQFIPVAPDLEDSKDKETDQSSIAESLKEPPVLLSQRLQQRASLISSLIDAVYNGHQDTLTTDALSAKLTTAMQSLLIVGSSTVQQRILDWARGSKLDQASFIQQAFDVLSKLILRPSPLSARQAFSSMNRAILSRWELRVFFLRLHVDRMINAPIWMVPLEIDENALFIKISDLASKHFNKSEKSSPTIPSQVKALVQHARLGGYHAGVYDRCIVDVWPRSVLNPRISKVLSDKVSFPTDSIVSVQFTNKGRRIDHEVVCLGDSFLRNGLALPSFVPQEGRCEGQEMQHVQDPFEVVNFGDLFGESSSKPTFSAESLSAALRGVLYTSQQVLQRQNPQYAQLHSAMHSARGQKEKLTSSPKRKSSIAAAMIASATTAATAATAAAATASVESKEAIQHVRKSNSAVDFVGTVDISVPFSETSSNKATSPSGGEITDDLYEIFIAATVLRSWIVQFSQLKSDQSTVRRNALLAHIQLLFDHVAQLAAMDPVEAMVEQFETSKFRGVQTEVLRSLLKEGDVFFLEKLAGKLWRLFGVDNYLLQSESLQQMQSSAVEVRAKESLLQVVALAGDIAVVGTKVRAISHFPSVKIVGVALEHMTGRWFYECTLLSDGLMQIGWSNVLFRCDPVCGQGVGDHVHSWAYDGLRMKKWNVSCEPYGKRWHAGDVVGVLVDMDLLEMRFFLNGEDLGAAFDDFSDHHLYPAISLNVRQSVRINCGQYQFSYPPNVIDGLPFRPVVESLDVDLMTELSKKAQARIIAAATFVAPHVVSKKNASATASSVPTSGLQESASSKSNQFATNSNISNNPSPQQDSEDNLIDHMESKAAAPDVQDSTAVASQSAVRSGPDVRSDGNETVDVDTPYPRYRTMGSADEDDDDDDLEDSREDRSRVSQQQHHQRYLRMRREGAIGGHEDDEDEDEEDDEDDDVNRGRRGGSRAYRLASHWQEDYEARIRMEADDNDGGDDYEDRDDDDDDEDERHRRMDEEDDDDDDEDDEEEDDEEDEGDGSEDHRVRHRGLRRRHHHHGGGRGGLRGAGNGSTAGRNGAGAEGHIAELRRQAMIESLIGMGFPIDWALRAAEHSDIATSESAAIAWIIERMEGEQSKMADDGEDDEGGDGDNDARGGNAGDFSTSRHESHLGGAMSGSQTPSLALQGMEYLIQRSTAQQQGINSASGNVSNASSNLVLAQASSGGSSGALSSARGLNRGGSRGNDGRPSIINRRLIAEQMAELMDGTGSSGTGSGNNSESNLLTSQGMLSPGSPAREELFGNSNIRRGLSQAAAFSLMLNDDAAYDAYISSRLHAAASSTSASTSGVSLQYSGTASSSNVHLRPTLQSNTGNTGKEPAQQHDRLEALLDAYSENMPWNDEPSYQPVLAGVYFKQRRQDLDKQEVLSQISELDVFDMLPIVATCQYALCIFYARRICASILQNAFTVPKIPRFLVPFPYRMQLRNEVGVQTKNWSILSTFSSWTPQQTVAILRQSFRQQLGSLHLPERLFPPAVFATETEDGKDHLPCIVSFMSDIHRQLYCNLSVLEDHLYPRSRHITSVGELNAVQELALFETLLKRLVSVVCTEFQKVWASRDSEPIKEDREAEHCREILMTLLLQAMSDLEEAGSSRFEGQDWISNAGTLQHESPGLTSPTGSGKEKDKANGKAIPQVLFAYWSIKIVLQEAQRCLQKPLTLLSLTYSGPVSDALLTEHGAWLQTILLPDSFAALLKGMSTTNDALRFCLTDLATMVLSLVNQHIRATIQEVSEPPLPESATEEDASTRKEAARNQGLAIAAIAAEFYVSAAKEKRLLQSLGARLKVESAENKSLYSRPCRSLLEFLLQWQWLKKSAHLDNLVATFGHSTKSSESLKTSVPASHLQQMRYQTWTQYLPHSINSLGSSTLTAVSTKFTPAYTPEERDLRVVQVSSTSITVCWRLTTISSELGTLDASPESLAALQALEESRRHYVYNLYIIPLSQQQITASPASSTSTSPATPLLAQERVDHRGVFRVDDLEPDTVYEITLRREDIPGQVDPDNAGSDKTKVAAMRVLVATEAEAAFGFQSESVSPHIVIGAAHGLSLRNVSNKKWSTARANVRLSSGVHRWDVHIDRCISKNIFVGVATREARLDNYVGCDACGWAFLANKAVWHNKAKTKTYGDLFRTGDTVTVILDLNLGTLSFAINDRNLGVAVEGLVGPLYPAFSLYNEEDQVTVAPVRSISGGLGPTSSSLQQQLSRHHLSGMTMGRSFTAEHVLDRIEALRSLMMLFDSSTGLSFDSSAAAVTFSDDLLEELHVRWRLWQQHHIAIRTVSLQGVLHTLVLSETAVRAFTLGRFGLGHQVVLEKRRARILGTGSHRLWLRVACDGELVPLTQDTLLHMVEKSLLTSYVASSSVVDFADESSDTNGIKCLNDLRPVQHYPHAQSSSPLGMRIHISPDMGSSDAKPDDMSAAAPEDVGLREAIVSKVLAEIASLSTAQWRAVVASSSTLHKDLLSSRPSLCVDDATLLQRVQTLNSSLSPFTLSAEHIAYGLLQHLSSSTLQEHRPLVEKTLLHQVVRVFLLTILNDLVASLLPLMPLLVTQAHDVSQQDSGILSLMSRPDSWLTRLRHVIFPIIKDEFAVSLVHQQRRQQRETLHVLTTMFREYDRVFQHRYQSQKQSWQRTKMSQKVVNESHFATDAAVNSIVQNSLHMSLNLHGFGAATNAQPKGLMAPSVGPDVSLMVTNATTTPLSASSPTPMSLAAALAMQQQQQQPTAIHFSQSLPLASYLTGASVSPSTTFTAATATPTGVANTTAVTSQQVPNPGPLRLPPSNFPVTSTIAATAVAAGGGLLDASSPLLPIDGQKQPHPSTGDADAIVSPTVDSPQEETKRAPSVQHHLLPLFEPMSRTSSTLDTASSTSSLVVYLRSSYEIQREFALHNLNQARNATVHDRTWQLARYLQCTQLSQLGHFYHRLHALYLHCCHIGASSSTVTASGSNSSASSANAAANAPNPNGALSGNHSYNITQSLSPYLVDDSQANATADSKGLIDSIHQLLLFTKSKSSTKNSAAVSSPGTETGSVLGSEAIISAASLETIKRLAQSAHLPGREPAHWEQILRQRMDANHVHTLQSKGVQLMESRVLQGTNVVTSLPFLLRASPVHLGIYRGSPNKSRRSSHHLSAFPTTSPSPQQAELTAYQHASASEDLLHFALALQQRQPRYFRITSTNNPPENTNNNPKPSQRAQNNPMSLLDTTTAGALVGGYLCSDYTNFVLYVETVLTQTQLLLDSSFVAGSTPAAETDIPNAGEVALILQHLHLAGVLLGMALRLDVPSVQLALPSWRCYELLTASGKHHSPATNNTTPPGSTEDDNIPMRELWIETCMLVMYQGLISMYPEAAWRLWTTEQVFQWLTPMPPTRLLKCEPVVATMTTTGQLQVSLYLRVQILRRQARFSRHLNAEDKFVQVNLSYGFEPSFACNLPLFVLLSRFRTAAYCSVSGCPWRIWRP